MLQLITLHGILMFSAISTAYISGTIVTAAYEMARLGKEKWTIMVWATWLSMIIYMCTIELPKLYTWTKLVPAKRPQRSLVLVAIALIVALGIYKMLTT